MALLDVEGLSIGFGGVAKDRAVKGLSFALPAGECLGLVGESGSGKSLTALALMGLLAAHASIDGSIRFAGRELLGLRDAERRCLRGGRIGMVFQDPLTALAPHVTVGEQIAAPLRAHRGLSRAAALDLAEAWLTRVHIRDPALRLRQHPHELSGGMRQRVMIAAALACEPDLLIADEPTTALDATVQAEVLDLIASLMRETGAALLLISHDMGVIARLADRVCVMRGGVCVEQGEAEAVLTRPLAPYTRDLIAAASTLDGRSPALLPVADAAPVALEGAGVSVRYRGGGRLLGRARPGAVVRGVDFRLRQGETLGVVGESGSGKSSLARAALRLVPCEAGVVSFLGAPLPERDARALRRIRADLQVVFQDPLGSLDPRMTLGASLAEPLKVHRPDLKAHARTARVAGWLERVGLEPALAQRFPHEVSGGQAQRVGVARAMIVEPRVVICDEAVSALDATVRTQVLRLLRDLQAQTGAALMFISHDLAVVREISHRVLVLHEGEVVEEGPAATVLGDPRHPYTRRLLDAVLPLAPKTARADAQRPVAGA